MKDTPHRIVRTWLTIVGGCLCLSACWNGKPAAPAPAPTSPDAVATSEPAASTPAAAQPSESSPSATDHAADPTAEELFVGWGQPRAALLITGQLKGYLEPCGCAGLANQKGGLARRHALVKDLQQRGWPIVGLDAGGQVQRFGRQSDIKFQVIVEGLKTTGYRAIAFGTEDLRLSAGEVASVILGNGADPTPFVSANVAVIDRSWVPRFQVLEVGDQKVGVTAILGAKELEQIVSDEVVRQAPREALAEVLPDLKQAGCDVLVLLSHAAAEETKNLLTEFPDFNIAVCTSGFGEPAYQPEMLAGNQTMLIEAGTKGMFAIVIGVFDDAQQPFRYQRVALDKRFADSPEMLQMLGAYQEQLKAVGLEGLGLKPIPHPADTKFVGSEKCGECHTKAFATWNKTPHAQATETLVHPGERSEIARHFDPECLSCHVTGWHAQNFWPYSGGYLSLEETPALVGNGCENCHGPGAAHVAAEGGESSSDMQATWRAAMRLPLDKAEDKCRECHDLDNDPNFQKPGAFERYWPQVEHHGLD